MTTERAKTVRGLLDEHRRRRAAVGTRKRKSPSLKLQVQPKNVGSLLRDRGINPTYLRY